MSAFGPDVLFYMPLGPCNKAAPGARKHRRLSFPLEQNMCSDNVNLPKEANKAKCFVIACFVLCASPGAHAGDGCTTKKTRDAWRQPCACLWSCSSSIISRNAHALRLRARSYHALHTPVAAPSSP